MVPVVGKCLARVLQQARLPAGFRGRHGRRQINQPLRIDREPAHHFQGGDRVFFSDRDVAVQPRADQPLAKDALDVQQIVLLLLRRQCRRAILFRQERAGRLVVGAGRGHRDQLPLRIAQGGQPSTEDAAGIDVDLWCTVHNNAVVLRWTNRDLA